MARQSPKRTRAHVLEKLSRQFIEAVFPVEWICRPVEPDYGIDLRVEIVTNEKVTGLEFSIQLKATDRLRTSNGYVLHRCKVSTAQYFLNRVEPVMYVIYDAEHEDAYWLWIQSYLSELDSTRPEWRDQETVQIRIPRTGRLYPESCPAIVSPQNSCGVLHNERNSPQ